jgi:class 3 adenylate cyclase
MTFEEVLDQALAMLQRRGRMTYRSLKRQFQLDDAALEDLKDELLFTHPEVVDESGQGLVWTGATPTPPALASPPLQPAQQPATRDTHRTQPETPSAELHTPEAERRQLTVVFCDLVDSTRFSNQLDPEDYRDVVRAYQQRCAEVVQRFDGHIAQLLGDGLLVYFGWPQAHEDDALRAVRTGLGMLDAMGALNARLERDRGIRLAIRVGIHTGQVVVGAMGGVGRQEQLALGEVPNVASRLQGLAAPDTLLLGEATYRLVEGYVAVEALGPQALKGVAAPMPMYRVLEESGARGRLEVSATRGLTPLVGREQEIGLLLERWVQAREGLGQVVVLSGEAGIGKSRVVQVLTDQMAIEGTTRMVLRGHPYHTHSALYPVIEHFERLLQFGRNEAPEAKLARLEQVLEASNLPLAEAVSLLAALLVLPHPAHYPPLTLSPQQQRQQTLDTLVTWLLAETERQPVLTVWEDLHWADPSTLELLGLVISQASTARLLTVLTCRPEFHPPWAPRSYLSHLTLNRLTRSQAAEMAQRVAGGRRLPAEVVEQIVTKTDGVPLFVEELTKAVLESGLLREAGTRYKLTGPLLSLAIPTTLQDSLMARLDRLVTAKGIAQLGAVIGRQFSCELLQAVSYLDEATLQRELERLVEAELLYQRGVPPQATYTFKHVLVQDAAYQSLLKRTRQQYHQRIAQVLEERFPETTGAQPEVLAYHYTEAGLSARAVVYWQRAGQRAMALLAYEEAVKYYETALGALELQETVDEAQRYELLLALGEARMKAGDFPQAMDTFHQSADIARKLRSPEGLARAALGFEDTSWRPGRFGGPAVHLLEEALEALGKEDSVLRVRVLGGLARALSFAGAPERAEVVGQQAIDMARRLGDPAVLVFALKAQQDSLWGRPERINEVFASAEEMLRLAEEIGDKEKAHDARYWRLFCLLELGDIQAADAELEALIRLDEEIRQSFYMYVSIGLQAMRALLEGRFADAERLAQQGLAVGQRLQGEDTSGVFGLQMFTIRREQGRLREVEPVVRLFVQQNPAASTWQPGLALVYSELGLEQEAREMFERLAANDFADIPRDAMWVTSMTYLAEVCAFLGDTRRADILYQRLLPYAKHNVMLGGGFACVGAAARYLGMLATTMLRWEEAAKHFHAALEINARMRARPSLAHTQQQYAEMLLTRGQPGDRDRAMSLLDEALAIASQLGMGALTDRVLACKLRIQGIASVDTKTSIE